MITFWLTVTLSIAGGEWQVMENVKQPDLESCLSAVASRVQSAELSKLHTSDGEASNEEYEVAVTCSVHKSHDDPA